MSSLDPVTPADLPGHLEHTEHHSRVVLVGGTEARVKEDLLSPSKETEERDRILDLLTGSGSHHSNLKVEGHTHIKLTHSHGQTFDTHTHIGKLTHTLTHTVIHNMIHHSLYPWVCVQLYVCMYVQYIVWMDVCVNLRLVSEERLQEGGGVLQWN